MNIKWDESGDRRPGEKAHTGFLDEIDRKHAVSARRPGGILILSGEAPVLLDGKPAGCPK